MPSGGTGIAGGAKVYGAEGGDGIAGAGEASGIGVPGNSCCCAGAD